MSSGNATLVLPNPLTPMAWLPKATANEFEASRYVYVATLAAFSWDWLMAWPVEYNILIKSKFHLTTLIYFLSRVSTLAYVIASTVFQVSPVGNCQALQIALGVCYALSAPSTSALFFLRVVAVFQRSRVVMIIFGILWLSILGTSITVPFAISGTHIGTTMYCVNAGVKSFSSSSVITSTVNDTLIFFAISWRLTTFSTVQGSFREQVKSFMNGAGLPKFSRMLLQGGQMYYAATVALNIVTLSLILSPSVPPVLRAMLTIPNLALENAMATRVFRAIHLGHIRSQPGDSHHGESVKETGFRMPRDTLVGMRTGPLSSDDVYALETRGIGRGALGEHIQITKTMETTRDVDVLRASSKGDKFSDEESGYDQV